MARLRDLLSYFGARLSIKTHGLATTALGTSMLLGIRLVTVALSLFLITRLLGPTLYGAYAVAASLAALLGVLANLGSGYVMLARSADPEAVKAVWRYAWPMSICLGMVLMGIYVGAALHLGLNALISIPILFALGSIDILVMPLIVLCSFALQAGGRITYGQFIQWLPLGFRMVCAVPCFFLPEGSRLAVLVITQMGIAMLAFCLAIHLTWRSVPLGWRPTLIRSSDLKLGASYSLMHFVAMNPSELDKVVAAKYLDAHSVGVYAAANRVMNALVTPVVALLLAAQPRLFQHATQPPERTGRLVTLIGVLSCVAGLCAGGVLFFVAPLLPILFGEQYREMGAVAPYLALVVLPLTLRISGGTILVALGNPARRVVLEIAGTCVLLGGIALLAPSHGLKGMVGALLASELFMLFTAWLCVIGWVREKRR